MDLFEEQVERTPDAKALVFEGRELTYRELDRASNRLASRLKSMGAGPDTLIGISMERSVELDENSPESHSNLGALLALQGDPERALEELKSN